VRKKKRIDRSMAGWAVLIVVFTLFFRGRPGAGTHPSQGKILFIKGSNEHSELLKGE
jgi:hypothetical protein